MVRRAASSKHSGNRLLKALPPDVLARVRPLLTSVRLKRGKRLQKQGESFERVFFPDGGIVSMMTVLTDGSLVEAATIGDEGVVGVEAYCGTGAISPCDMVVQVAEPDDTAEAMMLANFRRLLASEPAFEAAVAHYASSLHRRLVRLTACNARHSVNARCARWLLNAQDHVHHRDLHLSQESLAVMLGVRRQAVNAVATAFQDDGLIRYNHGHITVLNRRGLAAVACECYESISEAA